MPRDADRGVSLSQGSRKVALLNHLVEILKFQERFAHFGLSLTLGLVGGWTVHYLWQKDGIRETWSHSELMS